jgi:hypothetical protein
MKTPSRTSIVIVLAVIATVSVVIFQGCATESGGTTQDDKKFAFNLAIGKYAGKEEKFVEFKNEENAKLRFDEALRNLNLHGSYHIHYKKNDLPGTVVDTDYHPPRVSLKTDKVTTSELAKNEPPGDPNITQKVASNDPAEITKILDTLQNSP